MPLILAWISLLPLRAQEILFPNFGFENISCPINCTPQNGQMNCIDGWHADVVFGPNVRPLVWENCSNSTVCSGDFGLRLQLQSGAPRVMVKADNPLNATNSMPGMPMILSMEVRKEAETLDSGIHISGTNVGPGAASNDLVPLGFQLVGPVKECLDLNFIMPGNIHDFDFIHFETATEAGNHSGGHNIVIDQVRFCGPLISFDDVCGDLSLAVNSGCGITKPNALIFGVSDEMGNGIFDATVQNGATVNWTPPSTGTYRFLGYVEFANGEISVFDFDYEVERLGDCCPSGISASFDIGHPGGNIPFFLNTSIAGEDCPLVASDRWDFGDGTSCVNPGDCNNGGFGTVWHEYDYCGTYEVCLTVEDECGCESTICREVLIEEACDPNPCDRSLLVDFDVQWSNSLAILLPQIAYSRLCPIVSQEWSFGDGNSCTSPGDCSNGPFGTVLHQYPDCGNFELCLTVKDACGCIKTHCETVVVDFDCTGAERLESRQTQVALRPYPNPFQDQLQIDWPGPEAAWVRVYSLRGDLVWEEKVATGESGLTLATSQWAKGVYLLQWQYGAVIESQRIIKH